MRHFRHGGMSSNQVRRKHPALHMAVELNIRCKSNIPRVARLSHLQAGQKHKSHECQQQRTTENLVEQRVALTQKPPSGHGVQPPRPSGWNCPTARQSEEE